MAYIPTTNSEPTIVSDEDNITFSTEKWFKTQTGYIARNEINSQGNRRLFMLHRAVWEKHYGTVPSGLEIDHINRNKLDNRFTNLRLATRSQNLHNIEKKRGSSTFKGVSWNKATKKWACHVYCNNEHFYMGLYDSEIDAAKAYDRKVKGIFGDFAVLNF